VLLNYLHHRLHSPLVAGQSVRFSVLLFFAHKALRKSCK
jgi:hypothetical protein